MADLYALIADNLDPPVSEGWKWNPTPKQQEAIDASGQAFETLFGGSAAGGKSHCISNMAVDYALTHARAHIGIVRKTLPMLKQTHLLTLRPMLAGVATHNAAEMTWTFPNGSIIRFISLPHAGEEQNYKSVEFDRLFFDEVTELPEEQYTYLLTRLRSPNGHRVAAFCTANPEGVGYLWVRSRWVKGRTPGEVWHPELANGKPGPARAFVPATVYDNPHILRTNPDYVTQLEAIPDPRKRAALLHGDWDAMSRVEGALFDLEVIDANRAGQPEALSQVVIAVDPAVTFTDTSDETGIVVAARTGPETVQVLADLSGRFSGPEAVVHALKQAVETYEVDRVVYEKNQGADWIQSMMRQGGVDVRIDAVTARRGKAIRAEPVSVAVSKGSVKFPHQGTDKLEQQLITWTPAHPTSPDRLDAFVYAITYLLGKQAKPRKVYQFS
jgi:phage terminase large subunit-like protein